MPTKKETKEQALNKIYETLQALGYDEVILVGASSDSKTNVISMIKATEDYRAIAMAGMAIKFVSNELDMRSDKLGRIITEKLADAEDVMERMEGKKTNNLKITITEE